MQWFGVFVCVVLGWCTSEGVLADRVLDASRGAPVVCQDHGIFHECCDKLDRIRPLCVHTDAFYRCQWEPLQYFEVNVTVADDTLWVQCTPEVDLPVGVQLVVALCLFCCVSCLRADAYKRHGVILL